MSLIYCLITEPAYRCPTQPCPFSPVDVNTRGHLSVVQTNRASHAKKQTAVAGSALALDTGFLGMSLVV